MIGGSTSIGSPAYLAGLDRGDELVSVAGSKLATAEDLPKALASHKAGESVDVVFLRRGGQEMHVPATLTNEARLEIVPLETTGTEPTAQQKEFRKAWLGSKAKTD